MESTYLTGYVWAENIGWIKLGVGAGGPYANTASDNWGVNLDGSGNLSGYAWSENAGWINFNPTGGGVSIAPATGKFDGYAWGENIGWIHFQNAEPQYYVQTDPLAKYYRSQTTGNWSNTATWQQSSDNDNWVPATAVPDASSAGTTIQNTHTVTVDADVTTDQTTVESGGTLAVADGRTLTVADGAGTDLTVAGTLSILGTGAVAMQGVLDATGGAVTFTGAGALTLSNSVTSLGAFTAGTGTVTYNQAGAQSVLGEPYYDLTIAGGDTKTLAGAASVSHTLTLTSGLLSLGDNDLTLGASATAIGGTPSATNMIVTGGAGVLKKEFSDIGAFTFPVGDATDTAEYSPATLDFTSGTFDSGWAAVKVTDAKQPQNTSSTNYLTRYWTVTSGGISGFSCDTACTYLDADIEGTEASIYAGKYSGSAWTVGDAVTAAANTLAMTVSEFSDFTGVAQTAAPATQAGVITFYDIDQTTMTVGWTRGNGDQVLVVAHAGAVVDSHPVDGATYTANAAFGSGSQIGTGNYVLYLGTGTSVPVTGLTPNTTYHFRAYEVSDTGAQTMYNTDTATNNPNSQATLEGATKVAVTGPATLLKDGLGAFTLTSLNSSNQPTNVTEDTVFDLTTTGSGTFYSDAAGTTSITQVQINSGSSTATVYYRDDTFGAPTLTATRASGQVLDPGSKQIGVKGDNALSFDGEDDYVQIDNTGNGVLGDNSENESFTIETWFKYNGSGGFEKIFAKHSGPAAFEYYGYTLEKNNADSVQFLYGTTTANVWAEVQGTRAINDSDWHHLACAYDNSGTISLYIDGIHQGTSASFTPRHAQSSINLRMMTSEAWPGFTAGQLDEFRVWNTARTEAQIRANMHRELRGNEPGLAAYYKLDMGTGTTAYDSGPGGHHGTLNGGPTWKTSGAMSGPGNALDFDGSSNYVEIPSSPTLTSGTFSVEFWMKMTGQTAWGGIIDHGAYAAENDRRNWQFLTYDGEWKIIFGITKDNAGQWSEVTADVTQNKWHHVAGIYDGSTMSLYLDGVLIDTLATAIRTGDVPIVIGKRVDFGQYFNGQLDEIRVWNEARTPAQIRDHMARSLQGDEPGLMAYYRMDQKAVAGQTTLYDQTPNGNDGDLTNMDPTTDWVASTAFNTWLGTLNDEWNAGYNWSRAAVPEATDNVGIPDYSSTIGYPAGYAPTITGSRTVNHFVLNTGANATPLYILNVNGNLILNNNFVLNDDPWTDTVTVTGTTVNTGTLTISNGILDCNGPYDASGGSTTFTDAGNLKLASTYNLGAFTKGTGTVTFDGASAQTITGAFNPYNLTIDNAAGVSAAGATSLAVDNQLTVSSGAFTSKSDYHHVSIAAGATLALSGDITVSGNWNNAGAFTHNNHGVTLDGTGQTLSGTTTFYDLTKIVASADTLTFPAGSTTTVANTMTLQGAAGQLLSLRSSSDGTQWSINPQNTRTIGYLDVKDSNNICGTNLAAENYNCVDSGNNDNWFNTIAPTVTTQAATGIGTNTATGNGNITNLGFPNPTAHGVCWSTTANPTIADSKTDKGAAAATGAFTSIITGLAAGTTYHYRAYATNTAGTSYGEDREFITSSPPATYPVDYDANGATSGTAPDAQTKTQGVNLALQTNTGNLAKTGHSLTGWNTAADGLGTHYALGGAYTDNAAVTLYAQWSSSTVTIDPTGIEHAPEATTGQTVAVTAGAGVSWTATSNSDWITVTGGASGTGNGQVTYSLSENGYPNGPRTGTISIADKTFTVTQGSFDSVFTDGPAAGCEIEIPNRQPGDPYILYMNSQNAGGSVPPDTTFPWGLLDFKIVNVPNGGTVTLTVTMTSNIPAGSVFYKYDSGTYIPYADVTGLDDGDNQFAITLTDGGAGDQDGTANGEIVDPGGIGVNGAQPIPTLSEWGMIILACILAGLTLWRMRRQGLV